MCIPATQKLTPSVHANTAVRILQTADAHGWAQGKTKMFLMYEHVNKLMDILEGKKAAAEASSCVP